MIGAPPAASITRGNALEWGSRAVNQPSQPRDDPEAGQSSPATPASAADFFALGCAQDARGAFDAAIAAYRRAIELDARSALAHLHLGNALLNAGRPGEAIASLSTTLALVPDHPDAINSLGVALQRMRRLEQAAVCFRKALSLRPEFAEAYANLGLTEQQLGLKERAVASYSQAIRLNPQAEGVYNNLGNTLMEMGQIAEAELCYRRALEIRPNFAAAYSNMLYLHASTRDIPPEAERELAKGWEQCVLTEAERGEARRRARPGPEGFPALPRAGRRLRVGIVSAELGKHAVTEFLEPLLAEFDRRRFHITLFPTQMWSDDTARRIEARADAYVPLAGMPGSAAAERVRSEQIDVLMDTTGHTGNCHLEIFARRAAPVQLNYIGYWSTTGLTEMDWVFGDPYIPAACESQLTERIWRLPRISCCYRADHALRQGGWKPGETLWLGSFNRYVKIREQTLALWAKVLLALPASKLLLEDRASNEEDAHRRILATLAGHGIAAERVEFIPAIFDHAQHMEQYNRLDIALDTIPFNSGTTAFDALWMGVPLVALEGNWIGGCISSSALRALGREEWVATSEDEYVAIVCDLARDVTRRRELRQIQRTLMADSPLCDAKGLAQAIQDAFESMYDLWLAS